MHDRDLARPRVVVVGGGISGLAAAWRLAECGVDVEVREVGTRLGGILQRAEVGGITVDVGAESVLARRPEAVALIRSVGLGDDLVHPATTTAHVRVEGGSQPLPSGTLMGVPGSAESVRGLLPPADVERIAAEPTRPAPAISEDVSVGEYVAGRVGQGVVDRLVEPLLGGVYAGHAARLSLQATVPALWTHARSGGSLLEAVQANAAAAAARVGQPVFAGVRGGIARLVDASAAALAARGVRLRTSTPVTRLGRRDGGWDVDGTAVDGVVLAVPAPVASRLLADVVPVAATALAAVETADVVVAVLAVPAADLAGLESRSGLLVPPVVGAAEGRRVKALTLSSHKWGWVAEQDPTTRVLRVSLGRAGESDVLAWDDAEIIRRGLADAQGLLGRELHPHATFVQRWPEALPQYAVGHLDLVQRVRAAAGAVGRLTLAGAVTDGVGVPACIAAATRAADDLLPQLLRAPEITSTRERLR